jgi:hypothetical protein
MMIIHNSSSTIWDLTSRIHSGLFFGGVKMENGERFLGEI